MCQIHPVVSSIMFVFSLRPFSVQKVISTNLILVAVNSLCPCESRKVDIEPAEVKYNETTYCNRLLLQHYRKRPQTCLNYHPDVSMNLFSPVHLQGVTDVILWSHRLHQLDLYLLYCKLSYWLFILLPNTANSLVKKCNIKTYVLITWSETVIF